jgi:hypothetical protein
MPVAAREHRHSLAPGKRKVTIERRHHFVSPLDRKIAARQEVYLDVHNQHGILPFEVNGHRGAPQQILGEST